MQERIRYYITKSGEEPTVRSVKVAKSSTERDELDGSTSAAAAEPKSSRDPNLTPGQVSAAPRKSRGLGIRKRISRDA